MTSPQKAIKFLIFLATIVFMGIVSFVLISNRNYTKNRALHFKQSNEPDSIVNGFLYALIEDDITLAKQLVIPQQQNRIDYWKSSSQHEAFTCPYM